jgi:hypothetical protein
MFPRFWSALKPYCDEECDWEDCLQRYSYGVIDLWVTPCNAFQLTFNEVTATSEEKAYTGGWVYVTYSYTHTTTTTFDS